MEVNNAEKDNEILQLDLPLNDSSYQVQNMNL